MMLPVDLGQGRGQQAVLADPQLNSPRRIGVGLAPIPSPARGPQQVDTNQGEDLYMATSGDIPLATHEDFFMATDSRWKR